MKAPPHAGALARSGDPLVEVPAIDGFRAIAALMVITTHCWMSAYEPKLLGGVLSRFINAGYVALPIFFMISGFGMFLPTCRRNGDFGSRRQYAIRRIARIAPAYYVMLAGLLAIWPFVIGRAHRDLTWPLATWNGWGEVFAHLGFIHHELWMGVGRSGLPVEGFEFNGVIWTLSIEVIFYLLLPFVAHWVWKRPFVSLLIAAVVTEGWRHGLLNAWMINTKLGLGLSPQTVVNLQVRLSTQFPCWVETITLGMVAAWVYVKAVRGEGRWRLLAEHAPVVQSFGAVVAVIGVYVAGSASLGSPRDELAALGFCLLMLGSALSRGRWASIFGNAPLRWIGVTSYGAYLWHLMVIVCFLFWFSPSLPLTNGGELFGIFLAVTIPSALIFGTLSYRLVELPAIRAARLGFRQAFPGLSIASVRRRLQQPPRAGALEHSTDPLVEVPVADGFRGWAILAIVVYHCWLSVSAPPIRGLNSMLSSAYIALPMFFVISGFVMFLPTCRKEGDFGSRRAYSIRRIARIVPAYYVAIAASALLWPLVMQRWLPNAVWPLRSWAGIKIGLAHLTFLHQELYAGRWSGGYPGIGWGYDTVTWSLSIEALFYVALPFVAVRYWRRPFALLAAAASLELAWRFVVTHLHAFAHVPPTRAAQLGAQLYVQFPGYMAMIALGMTLAWVYVKAVRATSGVYAAVRRYATALQVSALALFIGTTWYAGHSNLGGAYVKNFTTTPHDELPAVFFGLLLLGAALSPPRRQGLFANPVIRWIGVVSYGVFLWHLIVIKALVAWFAYPLFGPSLRWFCILLVTAIPLSIAIGWASYRFLELPIMRAARTWGTRPRIAAAPSIEPIA